MKWRLQTRKGRMIATGTVEQMYSYLKNFVPDGEYQLAGSEMIIPVRRFRGVVYPFDRWKGWLPAEAVRRREIGG